MSKNHHGCSTDRCGDCGGDCGAFAKVSGMKQVGEVIAPVVEAVKRVWIGSGEDFPPEVVS